MKVAQQAAAIRRDRVPAIADEIVRDRQIGHHRPDGGVEIDPSAKVDIGIDQFGGQPRLVIEEREPRRQPVLADAPVAEARDGRVAGSRDAPGDVIFRRRLLERAAAAGRAIVAGGDVLHHAAVEIEDRRLGAGTVIDAEADRPAHEAGALELELPLAALRVRQANRAGAVNGQRRQPAGEPVDHRLTKLRRDVMELDGFKLLVLHVPTLPARDYFAPGRSAQAAL